MIAETFSSKNHFMLPLVAVIAASMENGDFLSYRSSLIPQAQPIHLSFTSFVLQCVPHIHTSAGSAQCLLHTVMVLERSTLCMLLAWRLHRLQSMADLGKAAHSGYQTPSAAELP